MAAFWHLGDLELLEDLTPDELAQLERASRTQSYDVGEMIFSPTPAPKSVCLLKEGAIRIYRLSDKGSEATFGYVQPGETFGELSAISELARESYAEAAAPSVVLHLPIDLFRRYVGSRPGVARHVSRQLGDRLRRIERRVEGLIFHDARLRLAVILHELAEHFGMQRGEAIEIDGNFTQTELATLVGCSRQTLNQSLGELESEGLVHMKSRRIHLPKLDALREFIQQQKRETQDG